MDKIFTLGRWSPGRVYSIPIHCYFTVGMLLVVYCYKFISRRAVESRATGSSCGRQIKYYYHHPQQSGGQHGPRGCECM